MTGAVSLQSVLVLLASSVLAVALCRRLKLPALVGYLVTGLARPDYAPMPGHNLPLPMPEKLG